jgi:hypothetical protein
VPRPRHRPPVASTLAALAACAALTATACAPVTVLQDARAVPKGKTRAGVAGAVFMPLRAQTYFEPDGPGTQRDVEQDLQYLPLLHVIGWARVGVGSGTEFQGGFQLPSFAITFAGKWSFVGRQPGSPFAMALSADVAVSPVLFDYGMGGTLHLSGQVADGVSLDVSGRVGTFPVFWHELSVAPTLGVTLGTATQIHIAIGGVIPALGKDVPGAWIAVGYSD